MLIAPILILMGSSLASHRRVVHRCAIVSMIIGCRLSCRLLSGILGRLLALPTFHLGFLKQPLLLCQSLALLTILDFVLPNEGLRWASKDTLVLTELTDPDVLNAWGMVEICVLLLDFALTRSQGIDAPWRSLFLPGCRGFTRARLWLLCLVLRFLRVGLSGHVGARLCSLRGTPQVRCGSGERQG